MNSLNQSLTVGNIIVSSLSRKEWAERMVGHCLNQGNSSPFIHMSVNGQVLALYHQDKDFRSLIDAADGRDADGQSLVIASRLLTKTPLPERVATTDLFHDAAAAAQEHGLSFYLLGSTKEKLDTALKEIRRLYPKLKIAGYRDGYFGLGEEDSVISEINRLSPDVLWVGMGVPRQESFVVRNKNKFKGVKWIKTCGGLFDYFSPEIRRAPLWMQNYGLEWLFRTIQEPQKYFKRYLTTNFIAFWLLLTKTKDGMDKRV